MLNIQKFIRENSLQEAIDKWNLKIYEEDGLIQLNYHLINSPKGIPEVDECRGLILRKDTFDIVVYPFHRFYNYGEGPAAKVNLNTAKLQEKADGSMIILYFNPITNKWNAATRGRIFADGPVGIFNKTFNELFCSTLYKNKIDLQYLLPNINFIFELIGPENRILTKYDNNELVLTGARNIINCQELDEVELDLYAKFFHVRRPKEFSFNSMDSIKELFNSIDPLDEGFVLIDYNGMNNGSYNRVKIKNPRYLAIHHCLNAGEGELFTKEKIVNIIRIGEIDELISYFPEYTDKFIEVKNTFNKLIDDIANVFESIKHLGTNRKEFALAATKYKFSGALFMLLDGKIKDGKEFLMKMNEDNLYKLLNI
ncbi:MAG: RNA ligase [Nanoarchaeota archaeon]